MTVTVQRIVDLTEHYGTSGAFIARLCGKSRSLIAGWKDGKAAPTDSDLAAIADLYGVSVAYLRGEVDVPESSVKNALQQQLLDSVQSGRKNRHICSEKIGECRHSESFFFGYGFLGTAILFCAAVGVGFGYIENGITGK